MIKAALRNPYLVAVLALARAWGLAVEVLEAEVALVRARAAEASALVDVHRASVALRRATGSV